MIGPFPASLSLVSLHEPLMGVGHVYLVHCTVHKPALVFSHKDRLPGWENINTKYGYKILL